MSVSSRVFEATGLWCSTARPAHLVCREPIRRHTKAYQCRSSGCAIKKISPSFSTLVGTDPCGARGKAVSSPVSSNRGLCLPGNAISRAETKALKLTRRSKKVIAETTVQANNPANSGRVVEHREISVRTRMRGGPGKDSNLQPSGYERGAASEKCSIYWPFRASSHASVHVCSPRFIGQSLGSQSSFSVRQASTPDWTGQRGTPQDGARAYRGPGQSPGAPNSTLARVNGIR